MQRKMAAIRTLSTTSFPLIILVVFAVTAAAQETFNVENYGAKSDGKTDCSKAFLDAWDEACASDGTATVVIPGGTFLTGPVTFKGPCKAKMVFQTAGTVIAPEDLNAFPSQNWIVFMYLKGLKMTGGKFDGRGASSWSKNKCSKSKFCKVLPTSIQYSSVDDSTIEGITSLNSKMFHIMIYKCTNINFNKITVTAPENSPNTDGIHMALSTNVAIHDAHIGTGDDCISIGPTNKGISISKVFCGPGHGISVGSLGKTSDEKDVTDLHVKDCTLTETMNGVRIKTWQQSSVLTARNFTFEDITMKNVGNPIIIDQEYCPPQNCAGKPPSKVKIVDMKFKNIKGTSSTPVAVNLKCSAAVPCQGVVLSNIHLEHSGGQEATSECQNVKGSADSSVFPASCI